MPKGVATFFVFRAQSVLKQRAVYLQLLYFEQQGQ